MSPNETSMGGTGAAFPETQWSDILSCADPGLRRDRMNALVTRYWKPVYRFIRVSWSASIDDSKDLAQEFFCHVLESDLVPRYDADRGRFRQFLKGALRKFLMESHRDAQRQKRGGGRQIVSLDVEQIEREPATTESPEQVFDRQWRRDVVTQALDDVHRDLVRDGKELYFTVFRAHEEGATYEDVARTFGITAYDVKNQLDAVRDRLHDAIVRIVTRYVAGPAEVTDEMRDLFHG